METISFCGTGKNSGKTTALNFVYKKLYPKKIIITSIGINGEPIDSFDGKIKPEIKILPGTMIITTPTWLQNHTGKYKTIDTFIPPLFSKTYILARAILQFDVVLEGPNSKQQILNLKKELQTSLSDHIFLIDGSIDRQFIADQDITDSFCFSINSKNSSLYNTLDFQVCSKEKLKVIISKSTVKTKSLLFSDEKVIFKGNQVPSIDNELLTAITTNPKATLYLNGGLTSNFVNKIPTTTKIILENFTLYQTKTQRAVFVKSKLNIKSVFIIEHGGTIPTLPKNVPVYNIFKEDSDAISI
jgi:hypothetical protein